MVQFPIENIFFQGKIVSFANPSELIEFLVGHAGRTNRDFQTGIDTPVLGEIGKDFPFVEDILQEQGINLLEGIGYKGKIGEFYLSRILEETQGRFYGVPSALHQGEDPHLLNVEYSLSGMTPAQERIEKERLSKIADVTRSDSLVRENTRKLFDLYGKGALTETPQSVINGPGLLVSRGALTGGRAHIVDVTDSSLYRRTVSGGWELRSTGETSFSKPGKTWVAASDPIEKLSTLKKQVGAATTQSLSLRLRPANIVDEDRLSSVTASVVDRLGESTLLNAFQNINKPLVLSRNERSNALANIETIDRRISGAISQHVERKGIGFSDETKDTVKNLIASLLYSNPDMDKEVYGQSRTIIRQDHQKVQNLFERIARNRRGEYNNESMLLKDIAPDIFDDRDAALRELTRSLGLPNHSASRLAAMQQVLSIKQGVAAAGVRRGLDRPSVLNIPLADEEVAGALERFDGAAEARTMAARRIQKEAVESFHLIPISDHPVPLFEDHLSDAQYITDQLSRQHTQLLAQARIRWQKEAELLRGQSELSPAHRLSSEEFHIRRARLLAQHEMLQQGIVPEPDINAAAEKIHAGMLKNAQIQSSIGSLASTEHEETVRANLLAMQEGFPSEGEFLPYEQARMRFPLHSPFQRMVEHLGTPESLTNLYKTHGVRAVTNNLDYIENASSENPFIGRTPDTIFARLGDEVEHNTIFNLHIPGYQEEHQAMFGTRADLRMRIRSVNALGSMDQSIGHIGVEFEMPSEIMSYEERQRQLAAYLVHTKQAFSPDSSFSQLNKEGYYSDEAVEHALGVARQHLSKGQNSFILRQEYEPSHLPIDEKYLQSSIEDFLKNSVNYKTGTIAGTIGADVDQEGEYLIDDKIREVSEDWFHRLRERYRGDSSGIVQMVPTANTEAMDVIERLRHVSFLESEPPRAPIPTAHKYDAAVIDSLFHPPSPEKLGYTNKTVAEIMRSSILDSRFMPLVGGRRIRGSYFEQVKKNITPYLSELTDQVEGADPWKLIQQVHAAIHPIDISSLDASQQELIHNLFDIPVQKRDFLNGPLARGNMFTPANLRLGEGAIEHGDYLSAQFGLAAIKSTLNRQKAQDIFGEALDLSKYDEENLTQDQIAQAIYEQTGIDMRNAEKEIGDYLTKQVKGFLNPDMESILAQKSPSSLEAMRRIRSKYFPTAESIGPDAKAGDKVAEDIAKGVGSATKWGEPLKRVMGPGTWQAIKANKFLKYGAIGMGALVGAGMLHAAVGKGDHTKESVEGPPNMPGSSYYDNAPRTTPTIDRGQIQSAGVGGGGVEYTVNANGNVNHEALRGYLSSQLGTNDISGSYYSIPAPAGTDKTDEIMRNYGNS